jgi:MYXO-CTERM domain-containing protein
MNLRSAKGIAGLYGRTATKQIAHGLKFPGVKPMLGVGAGAAALGAYGMRRRRQY